MSTLKEKIQIMQAALDGAEIQWASKWIGNWEAVPADHRSWNWATFNYRIKPQPKEIWVRHGGIFYSKESAEITGDKSIHYREVME